MLVRGMRDKDRADLRGVMRRFGCVLALALAMTLVGCGGHSDGAGSATGAEQGEQASAAPEAELTIEDRSQDGAGAKAGGDEVPSQTDDRRATEFAVDPERTDWPTEPPESKTVYLTFDDGPSAHTQEVLDILDKYQIKATFFVTNINPEYASMIGECHRRGHTIGMHTYTHDYAQVYASVDAYWDDLNAISELVEEQIGYVPCFIRFPGGSSNTICNNYTPGIMGTLVEQVLEEGYQFYDWDASCGDGAEHTADELVEATEADASLEYSSIVFLMHDGADKETTVEALPRIIEYFRDGGFEFAPIDRSTLPAHHLLLG